jgi:hypothetical protein
MKTLILVLSCGLVSQAFGLQTWVYPLHTDEGVMSSPYYTYQVETPDGFYSAARGQQVNYSWFNRFWG